MKVVSSEIPYLGNLPAHWKVQRLKNVATVVLGKMINTTPDDNLFLKPYLKSRNIEWGSVNLNKIDEMYFSEHELSLYRVQKNDLVVSEGGEVGKTSLWNNELSECYIQNSVHRIAVMSVEYKYLFYIFFHYGHSLVFQNIVNQVSIAHLTKDKLSNIPVPLPPIAEQQAIADYLDHETARIDSLIAKKRRLITLMREKRSVIINEKCKVKNEKWKKIRLKYFAHVNPSQIDIIGNYVFLPMEKISENGEIDCCLTINPDDIATGLTQFSKDDIILAKITPCFENGKMAYLDTLDSQYGYGSTEFHIIRPIKGKSYGKFIYYLLRTDGFRQLAIASMTGTAGQKRVPANFILNFSFFIPSFAQQQAIASYLDHETARIDSLVEKVERQIGLLEERRRAVITAAVTGRVRV